MHGAQKKGDKLAPVCAGPQKNSNELVFLRAEKHGQIGTRMRWAAEKQ
jgi:hypothetical protein